MILSYKNSALGQLLIVLACSIFPVGASGAEEVVTPEWLADRMHDSTLVLLHVGEQKTFGKGHIPGAQLVNGHMDFSDPGSHSGDSLTLELPSISQLESTLEKLGVSEDSTLLVYWSDEEITNATRVLFTLHWAGLGDRAHYLDGGLDAWKAAGYELSDHATTPKRGSLTLSSHDELVVGADWVRENVENEGVAIVDARSLSFYDGVADSRGVKGHIPGAGSTPWTELVDRNLKLKDSDALREIFASAGVDPGDTVVAYCHIGQYATMVLLAARSMGHDVKLYDGAFEDWAGRDLPVVASE